MKKTIIAIFLTLLLFAIVVSAASLTSSQKKEINSEFKECRSLCLSTKITDLSECRTTYKESRTACRNDYKECHETARNSTNRTEVRESSTVCRTTYKECRTQARELYKNTTTADKAIYTECRTQCNLDKQNSTESLLNESQLNSTQTESTRPHQIRNKRCRVNSDCEAGICHDGTSYDKYFCSNRQCELITYIQDPCQDKGNQTCTDSDGGKDFYIKGAITSGNAVGSDFCTDDKTLVEYYCFDGVESQSFECPDSCSDGACIDKSPPSDPETDPESQPITQEKTCEQIFNETKLAIEDLNHCEKDTDCKVSTKFGCPFGCYNFINKFVNNNDAKETTAEYNAQCIQCANSCAQGPSNNDLKCIANKCTISE